MLQLPMLVDVSDLRKIQVILRTDLLREEIYLSKMKALEFQKEKEELQRKKVSHDTSLFKFAYADFLKFDSLLLSFTNFDQYKGLCKCPQFKIPKRSSSPQIFFLPFHSKTFPAVRLLANTAVLHLYQLYADSITIQKTTINN